MLYAIKDSAKFTVISQTTSKPVLYSDYALTSGIEFTAQSVYAMNKQTKAVRFDSQREGTFKTEMEVFEKKWLSMLFGTATTTSSIPVFYREVLAVNAGGLGTSLTNTPDSGTLVINKCDSLTDTILGTEQTSGSPATAENTYSIANKALTFNATTFTNSGFICACYFFSASKANYTVNASTFPGGFKIMADSYIRGTDQNDIYVQYQLLNVKPKSNISLSMGSDAVTKLSIEWDILSDSAGNMMKYIEV